MDVNEEMEVDVGRQSYTPSQQLLETWSRLQAKLELIYDEDPSVNLQFIAECVEEVFNYAMHVTKENIELRIQGQQEFFPGRNHEILRDLHVEMTEYIRQKSDTFAENFFNIPDDQIFKVYAVEWRRFRSIHKMLQCIFKYLDLHYVPNESDGAVEVYHFALKMWYEKIFRNCHTSLLDDLLKFVKDDRDGRNIDRDLISCACKSFVEVNVVPENPALSTYEPLETVLLAATRDHYRDKSRKLMIEINVARSMTFEAYMNEIEKILSSEEQRVKKFFDERSLKAVITICEECLIKDHEDRFNLAFEDYLKTDDTEKIAQLFSFVARFPEDFDIFKNTFRNHVEREGYSAIEKLENVLNVDPKSYVEAILEVFTKYDVLVADKMKNDESFRETLFRASAKFMNNNVAMQASLNISGKDRNAEMLAKYCDFLLTKDSTAVVPEDKLKEGLKRVLVLVKLIVDKAGFCTFYESISSRRLVFGTTVSDEMEYFMIGKLQEFFETLGRDMAETINLTGLIRLTQNIQTSKDINKEFKRVIEEERDVRVHKNFSVMLIQDRNWPFKQASPYASSRQFLTALPITLEGSVERFARLYAKKFTGKKFPTNRNGDDFNRKLVWLHNLGKGEVTTNCFGKNYILMTGTFQMVVLMQFNNKDSCTYEELKKNAGIVDMPDAFLQQSLSKLFESKILLCSGDQRKLSSKARISLNMSFESKRVRVNLDTSLDFDEEINENLVIKHVRANHDILTSLAVVRIVKREKRISKKNLILQLYTELSKLFKPDDEMLKRSIDDCVQKDFIAVDDNDRTFYVYKD